MIRIVVKQKTERNQAPWKTEKLPDQKLEPKKIKDGTTKDAKRPGVREMGPGRGSKGGG